MGLITHSHAERMARAADKRRRVLAFLRTEIWTTADVIGELLDIRHPHTIRSLIQKLVAEELLAVDEVVLPNGNTVKLVGITINGQAHAAALVGKDIILRHYEKGRVGLSTIYHTLDLQLLRIRFAKAGWKGWTYSDRLSPDQKSKAPHRPDAVSTHPNGLRYAIEAERHLKTKKRYEAIIGHHLSAMRSGAYDRVLYATPTGIEGAALVSVLSRISRVLVAGQSTPFTDAERALFVVKPYAEAPRVS